MVDRIRYPTVSYLPFYYVFFQFLLLTIFNLQANILTTKDILSNLGIREHEEGMQARVAEDLGLSNKKWLEGNRHSFSNRMALLTVIKYLFLQFAEFYKLHRCNFIQQNDR